VPINEKYPLAKGSGFLDERSTMRTRRIKRGVFRLLLDNRVIDSFRPDFPRDAVANAFAMVGIVRHGIRRGGRTSRRYVDLSERDPIAEFPVEVLDLHREFVRPATSSRDTEIDGFAGRTGPGQVVHRVPAMHGPGLRYSVGLSEQESGECKRICSQNVLEHNRFSKKGVSVLCGTLLFL
jgi:hypothetical protein